MTDREFHYEAIVVGLGAMGAATLYQLSKMSNNVLGIDQYQPPHTLGSSNVATESRLTRAAAAEGDQYVKLARRSHQLWRQLEQEAGLASGQAYNNDTGGLMIGPEETQHPLRGHIANFVETTRQLAIKHDIAHKKLSASEIKQVYPALKSIKDYEIGYFEEEMGYLDIKVCVQSQLEVAKKYGANIAFDEKMKGFTQVADSDDELICVKTDKAEYYTKKLVLAVGPWIEQCLKEVALEVKVSRQIMVWFELDQADRDHYEKLSTIFWDLDGDYFYAALSLDGKSIKVGVELFHGPAVTPENVDRAVTEEEIAEVFRQVQPRLPGVLSNCVKSSVCLLTYRADGDFVIDYYPEADGSKNKNIIIVSACSGHGFKHSAAVGEGVAQQLLDGDSTLKLFELFGNKLNTVG
ncbi:MAG: N-methyl-L-tryptophan oxidase [Gammaproteobacteria bacterium]|nr:N-methyl-L-tryptophan oxidase [Gammaproteobacteria bacterium]